MIDRLRDLVIHWRRQAELSMPEAHPRPLYVQGFERALRQCADELEETLAPEGVRPSRELEPQ